MTTVTSGQTSTGLTATASNEVLVQGGGTVSSTTADAGGTILLQGGTDYNATIQNGGVLVDGTNVPFRPLGVLYRGLAEGDTVESGGTLLVNGGVSYASGGAGGIASNTTVQNGGTEIVSSGGTIAGSSIDAGTVVVNSGASFTGSETLSGGNSLFEFGSGTTGNPSGTIYAFVTGADGNKIEFAGYDSGASVTAGNGTVAISEHGSSLTVNINGITAGEHLTLDSQGFLGVCFLEGTHILAEDGERKVETLRAGDMVATLRNGRQVLQPVHWVGHRSVKITGSKMADAYPVRIRAGAFADAVPHRDLLITQEHCVFVDGKLIPARMLVNGRSIIIDRTISSYTYYHVELEQHGILLSEGLATESYLDTGNRGNFANHEAMAIRPDFSVNGAHKSWQTDAAAPLTVDRIAVEPVWRMLEERARGQGVASTVAPLVLSEDPHLRLATDAGLEIRPVRVTNGRYMFMVPATASELRLLSRTARPCETVGPFVDDRRDLGVLVGEVAVWHGRQRVVSHLHLTAPELDGWFTREGEPGRWTDGNAVLPVSFGAKPILAKAILLEVEVVRAGPYLQTLEAEEDNRRADRKSA